MAERKLPEPQPSDANQTRDPLAEAAEEIQDPGDALKKGFTAETRPADPQKAPFHMLPESDQKAKPNTKK